MEQERENRELRERLDLMESMIAEGRRNSESWGWTFLLWGVAYYVAIGWSSLGEKFAVWGGNGLAWPLTMVGAAVLTLAIGFGRARRQPGTTIGRAILSVWCSVGISMLVIFPALAATEKLDQHVFVATVAALLAAANSASGMILKWKAQIACAVVWWIASAVACFGSRTQLTVVFLAALFLCQIVFGIYAMISESRRRLHGEVHA